MPPAFVSVAAEGSHALRVRWSGSSIGPAEGSYSARYAVALQPGPTSLLVALPALLALGRRGGLIRLRPEVLQAHGLSAPERSAIERVLTDFAALIHATIFTLYGERVELRYELDAEGIPETAGATSARSSKGVPEGLLFGGGAESLLTLARLLPHAAPQLIGLCGPGWTGSDPINDAHKLDFDASVAADLGLSIARIETDAYAAMIEFQSAWEAGSQGPLFFANALAFSPLAVGLAAPLIDARVVASLHLGSESNHAGYHTVYCLSPELLHGLERAVAPLARFVPDLTDRTKPAIVRELWQSPALARHQSSCFSSRGERWCHACEKCFRSYALLAAAGADPAAVELDVKRLLTSAPRYARKLAHLIAFSSYHRGVYQELARRSLSERRLATLGTLLPWLALAEALRARKLARHAAKDLSWT